MVDKNGKFSLSMSMTFKNVKRSVITFECEKNTTATTLKVRTIIYALKSANEIVQMIVVLTKSVRG